jgi:hypothetical protein
MADGFQLDLDDQLSERLTRAAQTAGMSRADFTRHVLEQHLFNTGDFTWSAAYEPVMAGGATAQAYVAEEGSVDWADAEPGLRERLRNALSKV